MGIEKYISCYNISRGTLEAICLSRFKSSYFGEGPWIPQTPDPQQDSEPKEQWQEQHEGDDDDDG
jgi:hypothetical protein